MRPSTWPDMVEPSRDAQEAGIPRDVPVRHPTFVRRAVYWSPVVISMVLFAQVSFLGLRPAWCERRRLVEARAMMEARHARDLALRDSIQRSLRARNDPIFLERQRRMRLHAPVLAQR
jgi:hypothetical protein